jgi:uncharacterized protein YbcC (UPF0753/DUF2309 family)
MTQVAVSQQRAAEASSTPDRRESGLSHLEHVIEHAAHLLPAQGPITVFIHHNTLHALEDLPFDEAVKKGSRVFGCQPYLPEDQYRQHLARGRIRPEDISSVLLEDLGNAGDVLIGMFGTRYHLRLAMLEHPPRQAPDAELRWFVAQTDALRRFQEGVPADVRQRMTQDTRRWVMRDLRRSGHTEEELGDQPHRMPGFLTGLLEQFDESAMDTWADETWEAVTLMALWRICREGVHALKTRHASGSAPVRLRDMLLQATGEDSDRLVHEVLIRFCAAFVDQGLSGWPLPHREEGFFRAFCALYRQPAGPPDRWLCGLAGELARLQESHTTPLACVRESLGLLGVPEAQWEPFLSATLLALRGWAGMIRQVEVRGDRVARPLPAGSLVEFLAVRLILERLALAWLARETLGFTGPLHRIYQRVRTVHPRQETASVDQRAFLVFQMAQLRGWLPSDLYRLSKPQWSVLWNEIESFSGMERRRVFHLAFERRYRIQTLDAIAARAAQQAAQRDHPRFQVICCIDEREESFRRHLEELAPEAETFGVAGFFSVAMYYRGVADAHFVPLCPVVIRPQHYVRENVVYTFEDSHRRRVWTRRVLATASHRMHIGSRSFASGALLAAVLGPLASIPLVARILFPRFTAQLRRLAAKFVQPPPVTQLQLERGVAAPGPADGQLGYTAPEMAGIVERVLRDIGLISDFARLIVVTGHGSSSLNNPHESAHDCGACGGGRGGPNARAFAQMANDSRVRDLLGARGLPLPCETVFVGAYHNTCDDSLTFFDLERLPPSHRSDFEAVRAAIDRARQWNAHERCRRFESAPLELSSEAALRHVEARAEDLAQTRPEYGHATNAVCVVGRRRRTRGLFMDRRTFLTSYDPTQDDAEQTILTRVLQAVVPVCGGISLEYYFSFTDPTGWGCGTKLPHNITSLLGVMDGAASDLRTGLPWQMVEIHDPVRLLFVIESTPAAMEQIMQRQEAIGRFCRNGWVQLAVLSPDSPQIWLFRDNRFEPYKPEESTLPVVNSSPEWYRGWREHLGYALVSEASR